MDEYFEEALGAGSNHHHEEEVDEYLMKYSDESDSIDEMERRRSCRGFDCNICLDSVEEPVVTLCGHLYCWPCIYKWMNTNNSNENEEEQQQYCCPVCRSDISQDTLVPIYQTTDYNSSDHPSGVIIPPRPAIQFVESNSSILFFDNNHNIEETSNISISSYNGIFGKLVYWRFLGNSSGNPNNSYNLAGTTTSPRLRHHLMKMDESLNRMSFFLLCCALACLILF
ncbi:E3 ubiquitin-protein ligase RMA1H1-like [Impatiens glandulifera]|uniref:E3 ubiquitin-protein ligase RMA1H1-like n=1 Tax=Impatiens glandulifera TaxID=253017 RepID=UPI001FB07E1A|nr:E3 ubiquitin-protein ligase RMA1H1-like [Impatiens glandulifera]